MSDLDGALTRLVEREIPNPGPSFDGVRRRIAKRRHHRVVVTSTAVVAVVMVAGIGLRAQVAPTTGDGLLGSGDWRVDGPPPDHITVGGTELELRGHTEILTFRLDEVDTSAVIVAAGGKYRGEVTPCTEHTEVRILEQDEAHVRIGAYVYVMKAGSERIACPAIGLPPNEIPLDLGSPLDGRTVFANDSVAPRVVSNPAHELRAQKLPSGYDVPGTVRFEPRTGVWQREHIGSVAGTRITVQQGPPAMIEPAPGSRRRVVERPVVRGHPGEVYTLAGYTFTCLWWRERADLAVSLCGDGDESRLTSGELQSIAESLGTERPR